MFSGIIESLGKVSDIQQKGTNLTFTIESSLTPELKVDQSVAHNGVCLTVEQIGEQHYKVTAVLETLNKTTLGSWKAGDIVNLERCLSLNSLIDGHLVQGHVDVQGKIESIEDQDGSQLLTLSYPREFAHLLIEKGSITINGISLTAFDLSDNNTFKVTIIPYTWEHTMLHTAKSGDSVNLEFDLIGKYLSRRIELKEK